MFAVMSFDHGAPLSLADLPEGILLWVQTVGGFAMEGLCLWLLLGLTRWRKADWAAVPGWMKILFTAFTIGAFVLYPLAGLFFAAGSTPTEGGKLAAAVQAANLIGSVCLTAAGACAILAVCLPVLVNLPTWHFRRIYALAKLSFKEALQSRVLYAFSALLLVFLFASWFISSKPEHQVSTYVSVVFYAMEPLLLLTASLLAAFSIPADIRQQTIHTIVTKPVQRFEVVLGRFLGFLALMTLVLVVMSTFSLAYVYRGVNPEAAEESLKARVPVYGQLHFENTGGDKGINVGREWEYRQYITGTQSGPPQTARWDFDFLPASLGNRDRVRCEFGLDVFRMTKGNKENTGVACAFEFHTWRFQEGNQDRYREERRTAGGDFAAENALAEKYGFFEVPAQEITDYHTQYFVVPGGLFRNALANPAERKQMARPGVPEPPLVQVRVTCDRKTAQYVGMAPFDLYLREDTGNWERTAFGVNFYKAAFGLWLRLALVTGVAVILSTYFSGVISWQLCSLLFLAGLSKEFITSVALGKNEGGGPMEALSRLATRQLSGPAPDAQSGSTADRLIFASDESFRGVVRRLLPAIPDVTRFDLTSYVSSGFDIPWGELLACVILLALYLLPWAVLAWYLMRWREVASPN